MGIQNRFEVMLEVTTTLKTEDDSAILSELRESLTMQDSEGDLPEAILYDIDIYSNDGEGNVVVKVLADSELEQDDFACSVFFDFDSEAVIYKNYAQMRQAE